MPARRCSRSTSARSPPTSAACAREAAGSEVAGVVKANGYGLGAPRGRGRPVAGRLPQVLRRPAGGGQGAARPPAGRRDLRPERPAGRGRGRVARRRADPGPQPSRRARALRQPRPPAAASACRPRCTSIPACAAWASIARSSRRLDPRSADARSSCVLVMSHLGVAEEPDNPLNELQRTRFERLRRRLPPAPASLANSSGHLPRARVPLRSLPPGRRALRGQSRCPGAPTRWRRW